MLYLIFSVFPSSALGELTLKLLLLNCLKKNKRAVFSNADELRLLYKRMENTPHHSSKQVTFPNIGALTSNVKISK